MIRDAKEDQPSTTSSEEEHNTFLLKNLDSGETRDVRSESLFGMFNFEKVVPETNDSWKSFWHELHCTHDQLCKAAQDNDMPTIKEILRNDNPLPVDVNMKLADQWCALHLACLECHLEVVELLLKYGANPSLTNNQDRTALHIASIRGSIQICELLITAQVSIDAQDNQSNTALHYSAFHGHYEIVQLLLKNGSDPSIRNKQGLLPEELANDNAFQTFKAQTNAHDEDSYGRQSMGKFVMPNGRQDHVLKLLRSKTVVPPRKTSGNVPENPRQQTQMHRTRWLTIANKLTQSEVNKSYSLSRQLSSQQSFGPGDFSILSCLGKGSFGHVYLVRLKNTQQFFAMKVLCKQKVFQANLTRYAMTERKVLSVMDSPFVVKLHFAFQTENKLYLLMDYCPGGDLEMILFRKGTFKESLVKLYITEIVLALEALHQNCIIFRDLKPSNIVIDQDGHACLTDFGLSKCDVEFGQRTKSFCGSLAYLAPEMLDRKGHGFALDWYMLGVLTYELLDGYPPFYDKDREKLFHNIKNGKLNLPSHISEHCADFIKQLLQKNPQKRLGSRYDAQEIKQHPFFHDIDWKEVYERKLQLPKPYNALQEYLDHDDDEMKVTFSTSAGTPGIKNKSTAHVANWSFVKTEGNSVVVNSTFSFRN